MHIDDTIRRARPTEADGWADSPIGTAVLGAVMSHSRTGVARSSRRRRLAIVAAAAVVLGSTAAATVAVKYGEEPPKGWQVPHGQVACGDRLSRDANLAIFHPPAGVDAIEACRRYWRDTEGKQPPEPLFGCVYVKDDATGGGMAILPGPGFRTAAEACGSIQMYAAPADAIANPGS